MRIWLLTTASIWLCSLGLASIGLFAYYQTPLSQLENRIPDYPILTIGIICFVVGIILYRKLSKNKTGIPVNPSWVAYFYDFINLLFGTLGAYLFLNVLLQKLDYDPPIVNDEFGLFMGSYYFILGVPFVALYTCRLTSQSIEVTKEYIRINSMFGSQELQWTQLESINFADEFIGVGRVGLIIPKKLQRRLKLESSSGEVLMINEPQIKRAKEQIITQLSNYAPENFKSIINRVSGEW